MDKSPISPCAGCIVYGYDKFNVLYFALVKTHNDNWSFPKGKKNKGETLGQAGFRETREETGIREDQIELLEDKYLYELSDKGNLATTYFTGKCTNIVNPQQLSLDFEDKDELKHAQWISYEKVINWDINMGVIKERRIDLVKQVKKLL